MCGRFAITLPHDAMARLFDATPDNDLPDVPDYNLCPTDRVHAVLGASAGTPRRLSALRWGFVPHWARSPGDGPVLINARAESLAYKPAFRAAARARRCLVPASGFYEWTRDPDGKRLPWYVQSPDRTPLVFGGVWQDWIAPDGDLRLRSCAIVTTAANATLAAIHHRMPLVLAAKGLGPLAGRGRTRRGAVEGPRAGCGRACPQGRDRSQFQSRGRTGAHCRVAGLSRHGDPVSWI